MFIHFAKHSSVDEQLQRQARRLADIAASEESVELSLQAAKRQHAKAARSGLLALAVIVGVVLSLQCFSVTPAERKVALALEGVALFVMIVEVFAWGDTSSLVRLHKPLADERGLCAQLMALASRSPAVAQYVRSITQVGRQLRVFDVARANVVYGSEQYHLAAQYEAEGCVSLHSL